MGAAVRKRCVDCRKTWKGDRDRAQWCDACGGELRTAAYAGRRKRTVRRGR